LVLHEVSLHQGAWTRGRLVPGWAAGAYEHGELHRYAAANAALDELKSTTDGVTQTIATLANHWARMIEVVHCVEKIRELA
jgi:coenzyme F420-reducing hydrogenase alpha subunit